MLKAIREWWDSQKAAAKARNEKLKADGLRRKAERDEAQRKRREEQEVRRFPSTRGKTEFPRGNRWFDLDVVGESNYKDAIEDAEGMAERDERGNRSVKVALQREPDNPYDINAVSVLSPLGEVMGYLSRADAEEYAPRLDALDAAGYYVTCSARMGKGRHGYGVQLDLREPEAVRVLKRGMPRLENNETTSCLACPRCSKPLTTNANFCTGCGAGVGHV